MEEEPSRPFLVLTDYVRSYSSVDDPRPFRIVACSSKSAYGCGPNGDAIVKGLTLFALLGRDDDPKTSPELRLRATDEVFRRVGSELADVDKARRYGSHTRLSGRVYTVEGDVMVLCVSFIPTSFSGDEVSYYLVYDSAAGLLSLLPGLPPGCRTVSTEVPLKVEAGEGRNKYFLVLMAERSTSPSVKYADPVLCLWSPPLCPDDDRQDYSKRAWDLNARVRVNAMAAPFEAHVVLSCKGRAVWGDLAQGIMYCDCGHLIDDTEPVVFRHVMLPEECRTRYDSDQDPMPVFRTMGCVGGSIWFVVIEPSFSCPGDTTVKAWTLDFLSDKDWNLHREFRMQRVSRAKGLPETVPEFPFFRRQQEDDGGALYMFLREPYKGGTPYAHLVCIDLRCSNCEVVCLVSSRRMVFPLMDRGPVVLDPNFFHPRSMAVS